MSAAPYVHEMALETRSLGVTLHTSAQLIQHLAKHGLREEAVRAAVDLDEACRRWAEGGTGDAGEVQLTVVHEATSALSYAQLQSEAPFIFKLAVDNALDQAGGDPAPNRYGPPDLFNRIPGAIAATMRFGGHPSSLSFVEHRDGTALSTGASIVTFDQDFEVVTPNRIPKFVADMVRRRALDGPTDVVGGTSLLIADDHCTNHSICHWTFDWLPRVVAAAEAGLAVDNIIVS